MRQLFCLNFNTKDLFIFVIGLFSMIKIRLLGTFGVSELFVFVSYLFINPFMVQENKESIGFAFCSGIPVCKTL